MSGISVRAIVAALFLASAPAVMAGDPSNSSDLRWSGLYLGAHLGLHQINTGGIFDGTEPSGPFLLDRIGDNSIHGGIQAGYNWQWRRFVVGVEADYAKGGFGKSAPTVQDGTASEAGLLTYPVRGDLDYLATARLRAGVTASPDVLLYVTGGVGFTSFQMDVANGRSRIEMDATGLAFGAGADIALSRNVSLRAEWLRVNFDKNRNIADTAVSGVFDANDGDHLKLSHVDMMRVALNIKIGALLEGSSPLAPISRSGR